MPCSGQPACRSRRKANGKECPMRAMKFPQCAAAAAILLAAALPSMTRAADRADQKEVDRAVSRGLDWLASRQSDRDGHWVAPNGMYPTAITAMAATALLCEGSTTTQGKYAPHIRKAVDYL